MKRLLTKTITTVLLSGCLTTGFANEHMEQCMMEKFTHLLEDLTPMEKTYALDLTMQASRRNYETLGIIMKTCSDNGISEEEGQKKCLEYFYKEKSEEIMPAYGKHITVADHRASVEKIVELLRVKYQCKQELSNHAH